MFEDSLFASTARPSGQRGLTAMISFCVQAIGIGLLVLVPLIYTNAVPLHLSTFTSIPLPSSGLPPQQRPPEEAYHRRNASNFVTGVLTAPLRVPQHVDTTPDPGPAEAPGNGPYIPGLERLGNGNGNNAITNLLNITKQVQAAPPSVPHMVKLSKGVTEGLLIYKVTPVYPQLAILARQQGTVLLQATIGHDGTIQNLRAVDGPPLLIRAAIDAVKQWRYRPYRLNNEPVDVETQITVNFTLNQ